ncbi:MAG: DUF1902 domain-containing protein [Woeseia sp.]
MYTIVCAYDAQAKVWYVADSDVPGLSVEAPTKEAMLDRIADAAPELLRLNAHLDAQQIERAPIELLWASDAERICLKAG